MRTLTVAAAALACCVPAAAAADDPPQRTITVSGSAALTAINDTAGFGTGVVVRRANAGDALRAASARMQAVLDALAAQGIDRNDIRTQRVDVARRQRKHAVFYVATNTVFVTVRRITRTGRAIDATVRAGANRLGGLSFWRSSKRDLYQRALVAALRKAHANAQALADEAGAQLGPVQTIAESQVSSYSFDSSAGAALPERASAPVRAGRTRVTAELAVVYTLQ